MIKRIFNFKFSTGLAEAKRVHNSSKGFTVLESIVAILILSLAVSGGFSAVRQGLVQTSMSKDEIKAFYLAQEAIEIVRNQRDANRLANANGIPTNWLNVIQGCLDVTCAVDATGPNDIYLVACGDDWDSCSYLNQQTENANASDYLLYSQQNGTNWTSTNFKREIQIAIVDNPADPQEISVTVRITWERGILDYEYETRVNLFNLL